MTKEYPMAGMQKSLSAILMVVIFGFGNYFVISASSLVILTTYGY